MTRPAKRGAAHLRPKGLGGRRPRRSAGPGADGSGAGGRLDRIADLFFEAGMLKHGGPVKIMQTIFIQGKMSRNDIENDTDAILMKPVDQKL